MPPLPRARSRSPVKFFLLVFALSIPFLVAGALTGIELLPGLPLAALSFVCPAAAALILVHAENGYAGVMALLKRSFDYERIGAKAWYVPIFLLMPGVMALSYGLARLMGVPVPAPQVPILAALAMSAAFLVGALGEELGWSGYVIDPMQDRWGALKASVLLGLVWAAWHIVPLMQAHRAPAWIAWWCLGTVSMRVVMVWLYNNTGKSVFAVAVLHASNNVAWQLYPVHGSYFDPRVNGLVMAFVAVVVTAWKPRALR
jgi:uncharacterized protein